MQQHLTPTLAIFDLDNTLIAGDSDQAWGQFLFERNAVDNDYQENNNLFYQQYHQGTLDIHQYLEFCLSTLAQHPLEQLQLWRSEFIDSIIVPLILPKAVQLIDKHRQAGDILLIITATNSFVTAPIAQLLGIENLIAVEPEIQDNAYTGKVSGIPSFGKGKVERLNQWLIDKPFNLDGSYFYSDSINDLPLLQLVAKPIVVNADKALTTYALEHKWQQLDLRDAVNR
jgi:HAD superfamily hydrolase (TIGR01490 family)